ncbi:hypothetical protein BVG80_10395 [Sphingobacteriales bacterium TSM_CSM]|nr:hypothetical protein BVG80_10395 [Sphingobacteriales bacterium TSM_CSM]
MNLRLNQIQEAGFNKPKPQAYQLDTALQAAVEVAIQLGMPLLITGEPGTGKTQLAYKVAYDLNRNNANFLPNPLVFHTKTTSSSNDLFYQYDAIRHFYDAGLNKQTQQALPPVSQYIELQALGKAIALTMPAAEISRKYLKDPAFTAFTGGSVVLLDEIDKAPRDFPNDILYEIERFAFQIKEDNNTELVKDDAHKIIVIMTSNSEKNLPDAFLRRCVFYHIPFPDEGKLLSILQNHLGANSPYASMDLINIFMEVRRILTKKKPATAELLNWVKMLENRDFLKKSPDDQQKIMRISYSILAKTFDDLQILLAAR